MKLAVRGIQDADVGGLLAFSALMYGQDSYQSRRSYVDWLYRANPSSRGLADCLAAFEDGRLVGFIHRMRLPCVAVGEMLSLASLQNHVVAPSLRTGAGMLLLQRATRGERFSLSPGVQGRLGEAYRRLGYGELPSYWLMRVLRPITAATQVCWRTVTRGNGPAHRLRLSRRTLHRVSTASVTVSAEPDADQLACLADALVNQAREGAAAFVPWTPELLRWRFFSPIGPKHILIEKRATGAWAILSYGVKSKVNVVRLLDHDSGGDDGFIHDVMCAAGRVGAAVALAYTTSSRQKGELLSHGWRLRRQAPSSFVKGGGNLSVGGAATDVGFEALLTEVAA